MSCSIVVPDVAPVVVVGVTAVVDIVDTFAVVLNVYRCLKKLFFVQHSCLPNCTWKFDVDSTSYVVALAGTREMLEQQQEQSHPTITKMLQQTEHDCTTTTAQL